MPAPRLNRKLALQGATLAPDGAGGWSTVWTTLGELWAEVRPGRGRALTVATLDVSRVPLTITVRAAPVGDDRRPRPDQRLRDGTRTYRILAVRDADPDARYLQCLAEEEVTA